MRTFWDLSSYAELLSISLTYQSGILSLLDSGAAILLKAAANLMLRPVLALAGLAAVVHLSAAGTLLTPRYAAACSTYCRMSVQEFPQLQHISCLLHSMHHAWCSAECHIHMRGYGHKLNVMSRRPHHVSPPVFYHQTQDLLQLSMRHGPSSFEQGQHTRQLHPQHSTQC